MLLLCIIIVVVFSKLSWKKIVFVKTTFSRRFKSLSFHRVPNEGLYEFAFVLAEEILLLFYESFYQNFDYIIVKKCHPKIMPPKTG